MKLYKAAKGEKIMNYIFNKETLKIELHFDKADYDNLTEEQKSKLKSNFLWSNFNKCWVSRAKEPNLYFAKQTAKELGFTEMEAVGERLTYEEQLERKAERAEARAERYEEHAQNATKRGQNLQSELNKYSEDWSFVTQPNINTSSGRAFTNFRERLIKRYEKGFEEYRKSDYFKSKAQTALETAQMQKLQDKGYLERKIKECTKTIKTLEKRIISNEETIYEIEQGKVLKDYEGNVISSEQLKKSILEKLERIEAEMDKQAFFENKLEELGGVNFGKHNLKVGEKIKMKHNGITEIATIKSLGTLNIKVIFDHFPCPITRSYTEIYEKI
jgi:phage shock protein A